ncbi:MAG: hypothetical protein DCC65_11825 [Planctomycetota bacterium]|nr:MAG: hypothetical protein DCC65_11825 [Planctomycetota bacterium]
MSRPVFSGGAAAAIFAWPLVIVVAGLAARLPLMGSPGFLHDQEQFIVWGMVARDRGLAHVYDVIETPAGPKRLSNYPPVQNLICRWLAGAYGVVTGRPLDEEVLGEVARREESRAARAAYTLFKWPAMAADLAAGLALYYFARRRAPLHFAGAVGLVYVLLPNVWHNSAAWGAVDALPALAVLFSLEAALGRRMTPMWGFAALAVLIKPQACIFAPLWVLATLRPRAAGGRQMLGAGAVAAVIALAVIAPFRGALGGVREAYTGAPAYYPLTHLNGFSAWFLGRPLLESHLEGDLLAHYARDDRPVALGLTARQIGVAAFLGVTGFVCVSVWRRKADDASLRWAACVIPLAFFVLSTQMHERYLYPAVASWAWAMSPARRAWIGLGVLAACAGINVFWVWPAPWEESLRAALHRTWLGIPPGVWCAAGVAGVLVWTLSASPKAWGACTQEVQPSQTDATVC